VNALVLVDIQNDFLPGGALPVPRGDEVIAPANRLQTHFERVVATQDWHPPDHGSFAANHRGKKPGDIIDLHGIPQILWPVHCVQGTRGAHFAPELRTERIERVFRKGVDVNIDSYSGFFDNGHRRSTGLGEYLKQVGVAEIYIAGLATDYCVKFSALDARWLGFRTYVIEDVCRGIDLRAGDIARALHKMRQAGATIISSREILRHPYATRSGLRYVSRTD
jgi:nicotinamidase/pyrazinamidase